MTKGVDLAYTVVSMPRCHWSCQLVILALLLSGGPPPDRVRALCSRPEYAHVCAGGMILPPAPEPRTREAPPAGVDEWLRDWCREDLGGEGRSEVCPPSAGVYDGT